MLRVIIFVFFANTLLFCQSIGMMHVRTPIQWMDTLDHKVLCFAEGKGESNLGLYFSDGRYFSIPLPAEVNSTTAGSQVALTENGIDLITRTIRRTFNENEEVEATNLIQFFYISYDSIKNGERNWEMKRELRLSSMFNVQLVPLNETDFLACLSLSNMGLRSRLAEKVRDWIIYRLDDNNRFVELESGNLVRF